MFHSFNPAVALIVMPIPLVIAALVLRKSIQLRRASKWIEGRARITKSEVKIERHRWSGEAATVTNKASVKYEFHVGSRTFNGERISIGDNPPDGVDATLKRYSVGADVPVFYDPTNPSQCVLDRTAPVSLGCLWSGAAVIFAVGVALTFAISSGESIDDSLEQAFPSVHHPLMTICVASMGSFCLLMYWVSRRRVRQAAAWPVIPGRIVSSKTESFLTTRGTHTGSTRMYRAAIEYAYAVNGKEYRSTQLSYGGEVATGSQARAEARAASFPVGKALEVHCDPDDPTNAVLKLEVAQGGLLIVVALILFGVAALAALHA